MLEFFRFLYRAYRVPWGWLGWQVGNPRLWGAFLFGFALLMQSGAPLLAQPEQDASELDASELDAFELLEETDKGLVTEDELLTSSISVEPVVEPEEEEVKKATEELDALELLEETDKGLVTEEELLRSRPAEPAVEPEEKEVKEEVVKEPEEKAVVQELVFSRVRLQRRRGRLKLELVTDGEVKFTQEQAEERSATLRLLIEGAVSFKDGKTDRRYQDDLLERIYLEAVPEDKTRLVVELRSSVANKVRVEKSGLVLELREPILTKQLLSVRLLRAEGMSRLLLDLSSPVKFSSVFQPGELQILLRGVNPKANLLKKTEDERLRLHSIKRQNGDTLLRVLIKDANFVPRVVPLDNPPRLVVDVLGEDELKVQEPPPPLILTKELQAKQAAEANNLAEAISKYQEVFEENIGKPLGWEAFWAIGNLLHLQAQQGVAGGWYRMVQFYQGSLAAFSSAPLANGSARLFYQLGIGYRELGLLDKSEEVLSRLEGYEGPEGVDALYLRGRNALDRNDVVAAVEWFRQMRQRVSLVGTEGTVAGGVEGLYWQGVALQRVGQLQKALRLMKQALELDAKYPQQRPELLFALAETFVRYAPLRARIFYRRLFRLEGGRYYALLTKRGRELQAAGKSQQALAEFRKLQDYAPLPFSLRADLEIAKIWSGGKQNKQNFDTAMAAYERVIVAGTDAQLKRRALYGQAALLLRHRRTAAAVHNFERLLVGAGVAERRLLLQKLADVQSGQVVALGRKSRWKEVLDAQRAFAKRLADSSLIAVGIVLHWSSI